MVLIGKILPKVDINKQKSNMSKGEQKEMEIVISVLLDVLLCGSVGALVFQCGTLAERHRELSYTISAVEAMKKEVSCACVADNSAMPPLVKPPEATETDFEGVKIWKPRKKEKAVRKARTALQT